MARVDTRNGVHVKTVQCEGVQPIGMFEASLSGFSKGVNEHDEIVCLDIVASLYERRNWFARGTIASLCCNVPIAVGGGIRSLDDAQNLRQLGADRIIVNTAAIKKPHLISEIAESMGSQAVVLQIDTRRYGDDYYCFTMGGREPSALKVSDWLRNEHVQQAGEVMVTSIESEGTDIEFPHDLVRLLIDKSTNPLILSGGISSAEQIISLYENFGITAFCFSSIINRKGKMVREVRAELDKAGLPVRRI
jgi:cyclase